MNAQVWVGFVYLTRRYTFMRHTTVWFVHRADETASSRVVVMVCVYSHCEWFHTRTKYKRGGVLETRARGTTTPADVLELGQSQFVTSSLRL